MARGMKNLVKRRNGKRNGNDRTKREGEGSDGKLENKEKSVRKRISEVKRRKGKKNVKGRIN